MLRHYIVLSGKVLLRRKFFTFISLFGISFTLLVLMVVTATLDHAFGPAAPETRQDRMLAVRYTLIYGPHTITASSGGFRLFDQYARNLPGVERLSLFTTNFEAFSYIGGQKLNPRSSAPMASSFRSWTSHSWKARRTHTTMSSRRGSSR